MSADAVADAARSAGRTEMALETVAHIAECISGAPEEIQDALLELSRWIKENA